MAERTDELTEDVDVDVGSAGDVDTADVGVDATEFGVGERTTATESTASETRSSRVDGVKQRAASAFSPTAFAVHLAGALLGVFAVGNLIPLIPFTGFVGLLLMAGLLGTLSSEPRYAEAAVAGGISGALALFLGSIGLSVVTGGIVPVVGAVIGAVAGLVGFYAGRDLRDGLTKDL